MPDSGGSSGLGYELCLQPHYAWIQNMFRAVPFARGFIKKEKLRELDVEIRKYVAGGSTRPTGRWRLHGRHSPPP